MSEQRDGGPAGARQMDFGQAANPSVSYARLETAAIGAVVPRPIELRDYFAAAALQGLIANQHMAPDGIADFFNEGARRCYQMADAMLRARRQA